MCNLFELRKGTKGEESIHRSFGCSVKEKDMRIKHGPESGSISGVQVSDGDGVDHSAGNDAER